MNVTNKKQNFNYPQYDMLTLCIELAANNQTTVDLIPDFKTDIAEVKSNVDAITILIAQEKQNTTGTAIQKRELKYSLAGKMFKGFDLQFIKGQLAVGKHCLKNHLVVLKGSIAPDKFQHLF